MVRWRSLVCKVHSEPLRLLPGSKRLSVVALALMATVPATILPAQFVLWQKFPISQPFSVTTAVRGLITTTGPEGPTPQVRFEGLTGYFTPAGNRFDYHSSVAVDAQEPVPGTLVIDTRNPIPFTDSGVQSAFNGLCCSNNAFGTDIDTSIYPVTDFSVPESFEVTIGVPELGGPSGDEELYPGEEPPARMGGPRGSANAGAGVDPPPWVANLKIRHTPRGSFRRTVSRSTPARRSTVV